jgi:aspartate carbamoyltransferase catalytic subunit
MMPIGIPALEAVPASLRKQQNITPEQFRVTAAKIRATGSKTLVLHPGPRKDELSPEVDSLPNGLYFDQVRESVFVRMAVLAQLCGANLRRTDRPDAAGVQEAKAT